MRLVMLAAGAIAIAAPATPASADGARPVLAPNEVSLEIVARGVDRSPADKVSVTLTVTGRGAGAAEARRTRTVLEAKLIAAARQAGIAPADIRVVPAPEFGFIGNEALEGADVAALLPNAAGEIARASTDSSGLELQLRDPAAFPRLRDALEAAGAVQVPNPEYTLIDATEAHRRAKADALRRSREEAEAYARAAGMRVVRLVRVTERVQADFTDVAVMRDYMRQMRGSAASSGDEVETTERIEADYALAPR